MVFLGLVKKVSPYVGKRDGGLSRRRKEDIRIASGLLRKSHKLIYVIKCSLIIDDKLANDHTRLTCFLIIFSKRSAIKAHQIWIRMAFSLSPKKFLNG